MASNVITLNHSNAKATTKDRATNNCGSALTAVIASFGQAKALRDLPRHLKAGAL